ncbi:MAG: ribonuclease E inhibitor RraB [Robiginitomaculum sp.]|nr:ribonuclease E inhibitor RraB [Robiginitomaculum sp.]
MKFPNDDDGDVLYDPHKEGVDLALPRELGFYCYAANLEVAEKIAARTVLLGFDPDIYDDKANLDPATRFSV